MDSSTHSNSTPPLLPPGTFTPHTVAFARYVPGSHHTRARSPTLMVSTAAERPGGSVPSPLTHRTVRVDKKLLSFPSGVFPVSSS